MYILRVERRLAVTHALTLHGVEEPMHDHDWRIVTQVSSSDLDEIGAVMDFNELLAHVDTVLAPLQGRTLNALPAFAGKNPSSEAVAGHVFTAIAPLLPGRVRLDEVTVYRDEAVTASFSFRP